MGELSLGYSPCPNDTFIFYGLASGLVASGDLSFKPFLADVETLNRACISRELHVSKISFFALGRVSKEYGLLRAGGALGRGCGPLIVARGPVSKARLLGTRIAVPGAGTTANLLLQLFAGQTVDIEPMPFETIMPAVKDGLFDAGVIIHEGRFTYPEYGLVEVLDLGAWWEESSGLPLPLGGIVIRRSLGRETAAEVERLIRESVSFARKNPGAAMDYVREHAQEMDDFVMMEHIRLYVNEFSLDLGEEGAHAVEYLLARAHEKGLGPRAREPIFAA